MSEEMFIASHIDNLGAVDPEEEPENRPRLFLTDVEYFWRSTQECYACSSQRRQTHFGWGTVCFDCQEKEPDDEFPE